MNTNALICLDKRHAKKDGTYPLILRISHNRRTTGIPLGYFLHEKDFDSNKREVRQSYKGIESVKRMNNLLISKKAEALGIITKLEESGELDTMSVSDIKKRIVSKKTSPLFFEHTDKLIDELKLSKRHGNARNYKSVLLAVKAFRNNKDFPIGKLDYKFLKSFEAHHLAKGNSYNGLSVYMRGIRAIYNKAVRDGLVENKTYPFQNYRIKSQPTQKRALSIDALKKIMKKKLEPEHPCFEARNYFLISFFMYGINFIDMAFLTMENISDGRITFRRRKTGKTYDIKITEQLESLLSFYTKGKSHDDFIFPIIKRKQLADQYKDVENQRRIYNKTLKNLAKVCKLDENLTSYVSRHSFATQAMMQNIPLQAISAMLGHSKLSTTEVYLKGLPSNVLDEYNAKISLE